MSFTLDIKNELVALTTRSACCRRMICEGLLLCAVPSETGSSLTVKVCDDAVAGFIDHSLRDHFRRGGVELHRSARATTWALPELPTISAQHMPSMICEHCLSAFLRGVFLACGTVNSPEAMDYHAELLLGDAMRARVVCAALDKLGCSPRIIDRPHGVGLYFKSSESIEALLVGTGATSSAFTLMNSKIERTIRNDENRATNCVTKNIARAVAASRRYITAINALESAGMICKLGDDVQTTARLRAKYPSASLSELAALHKPPITKSGLNHRLAKILELYNQTTIK